MQALKPSLLEDIALFSGLTDDEIGFLRSRLHQRSFRRGSLLLTRGEMADGLYVIRRGLVGVGLGSRASSEQDIATLGAGECVGEMSIMTGEPCSANIRALVETETYRIDREDFAELVERCPTLWRNFSAILSRRLLNTNRRLDEAGNARFTNLYLLMPPATAEALARLLAASLAHQTGGQVLLLQESEGAERTLSIETILSGYEAAFDVGHRSVPSAASPAQDHADIEELRSKYREVILVGDRAADSVKTGLSEASTAAIVVADHARLAEGCQLAVALAEACDDRVDLAILTDFEVGSDNGDGGLWPREVLALDRQARNGLGEDTCVRRRFLPRMPAGTDPAAIATDNGFGRAIARLARRIGRMEVGLALGAGMAKGFSHIGVLRALRRHHVPIDYIAGASIGSIVGSVYAGGMALEQLEALMTGADRRFVKPTLPLRSLSSNRGLRKILTGCHERAPTAEFPELFTPFAAIATDIGAGESVVLADGLVWETVLASISMPGIFPAVVHQGRVLADGGLVNPVPVQTLRDMGADIVIAVDLAAHSKNGASKGRPRVPNLIEMMWRTMEIMLGEITHHSATSGDVVVRPRTGHSHVRDFSRRGPEFIAAGEAASEAAIPEIAALLPAVGRKDAL